MAFLVNIDGIEIVLVKPFGEDALSRKFRKIGDSFYSIREDNADFKSGQGLDFSYLIHGRLSFIIYFFLERESN